MRGGWVVRYRLIEFQKVHPQFVILPEATIRIVHQATYSSKCSPSYEAESKAKANMGSSRKRAAIILAAGKSTRMKSARPKVLHEVGGQSMLAWAAALARSTGAGKIVAVIGGANTDVRAAAEDLGLDIAVQEPQLGTGHAVLAAKDALMDFNGEVVVLYADTPLIRPETLEGVFAALETADVAVLGFEPEDPGTYGRLIEEGGELFRIVEARDATPEEFVVGFCNSGVMATAAKNMFAALAKVDNDNAKGEYYLTDIVGILKDAGKRAVAVAANADEVLGVNNRSDLALAEQAFQARKRTGMMDAGVTLRDPASICFSFDTEIAPDADIGANVVFGPGVRIGSGTVIHPFCHLEGAKIARNVQIGPFARLRPGTEMATGSRAGNFVETKKAKIGKNSKINHLSYIGDAKLGEKVNIGAGTITCNYDGFNKHVTTIEDGVFVGTHSSLVAPLTIGAGAYLATGGVITTNVPRNALALARSRQTNKEGWAKRYRDARSKKTGNV